MRFIRKVTKWLLVLFLGFFIGIVYSYWQDPLSQLIQTTEQIETTDQAAESEKETFQEINPLDLLRPSPDSVDYAYIESTIIELVNALRTEQGLNTVTRNQILTDAANIRAVETETSFSHTRPNGLEPFTVLKESGTEYPFIMAGENLAMATYHRDDEYMTQLIFNGWVESDDHFQTMINPDFKEIGVGVHYDGEILYVTQFFGTTY